MTTMLSVVSEVLKTIQPELNDSKVEIKKEIPEDLPSPIGNVRAFVESMGALISAALKETPATHSLRIGANWTERDGHKAIGIVIRFGSTGTQKENYHPDTNVESFIEAQATLRKLGAEIWEDRPANSRPSFCVYFPATK